MQHGCQYQEVDRTTGLMCWLQVSQATLHETGQNPVWSDQEYLIYGDMVASAFVASSAHIPVPSPACPGSLCHYMANAGHAWTTEMPWPTELHIRHLRHFMLGRLTLVRQIIHALHLWRASG